MDFLVLSETYVHIVVQSRLSLEKHISLEIIVGDYTGVCLNSTAYHDNEAH